MQRVAVKVSSHVEPSFVVVVGDIHEQRVAFPVAARIPHPEIDSLGTRLSVRINQAKNLRPLESDRNVISCLKNMKGKFHVHDSRDTWHIALPKRIGCLP